MKKKTLRIVTFILALAMLSGCSKNQEQTEPTSINQAMLIEKSAQEQESYSFPEKFTGDWTAQEGKLTIHADAEVVAEQGVILPTATVAPRIFTQADVDNLLKVFLKGAPLYDNVPTKADFQESIDRVNFPDWQSDPDGPPKDKEKLLADYQARMEAAPEEQPIIHGFSDSSKSDTISGTATVDGNTLHVHVDAGRVGKAEAAIYRTDFAPNGFGGECNIDEGMLPSTEKAIAMADALLQELGMSDMVCDDVQPQHNGTLNLYYVPTVNGIRLNSIREDVVQADGSQFHQYSIYARSEEKNPDTVSWYMENIQINVGSDGIYSFVWRSPSEKVSVKQAQSALLSFDEIASIADTMLPIVILGPKETSLVDLDRINGFDTHMDVEITKVSLTLMRIRDKGSMQGTIVPVWDFRGTWDWYEPGDGASDSMRKGANYTTQPMLTLNAIDGNVVNRQLGY